MNRIIFLEASCPRCRGCLTFCYLFDLNRIRHVRVKCEPCDYLAQISITKDTQKRYATMEASLPRHYTRRDKEGISANRQIYFVEPPMTEKKWSAVVNSLLPFWAYSGPDEWVYRVGDGMHVCKVPISETPDPVYEFEVPEEKAA